jgi:hypothetical protein
METVRIFGFICAALALTAMFELIRRQHIKEKYTVLWMLTAIAIVAVAIYPRVIDLIADATGIRSGPNVLLLVGGLVIIVVCVQLSIEVSRLEDRSRALAEEIGLLRLELATGSASQRR